MGLELAAPRSRVTGSTGTSGNRLYHRIWDLDHLRADFMPSAVEMLELPERTGKDQKAQRSGLARVDVSCKTRKSPDSCRWTTAMDAPSASLIAASGPGGMALLNRIEHTAGVWYTAIGPTSAFFFPPYQEERKQFAFTWAGLQQPSRSCLRVYFTPTLCHNIA